MNLIERSLLDFSTASGLVFTFNAIILQAIYVIANWNIFKKIGEKPYKSLFPFYQEFVIFRTLGLKMGVPLVYSVMFLLTFILNLFPALKPISALTRLLYNIFYIILYILKTIKLSDYFGKGPMFKVGLMLIHPMFMLILAFGRSRFLKDEVI